MSDDGRVRYAPLEEATRYGPPPGIAYCRCGGWYGTDRDGEKAHKAVMGHWPMTSGALAAPTSSTTTVRVNDPPATHPDLPATKEARR